MQLRITCFVTDPHVFVFEMDGCHTTHIPGDRENDLRTFPLSRSILSQMDQVLASSGQPAREVKAEMLRHMDRLNKLSLRRVNYHDVHNRMKKVYIYIKTHETKYLYYICIDQGSIISLP